MKCLVFYGTAEGHTLKIAQSISEQLKAAGHEVSLQDASKPVSDIDLTDLGAFFAAAPVHQQRHPDAVIDFIKIHSERLDTLPSALISVSLSAALRMGGQRHRRTSIAFLSARAGGQQRYTWRLEHCVTRSTIISRNRLSGTSFLKIA